MVVDWGRNNQHLCFIEKRIYFLHIILLYALPFSFSVAVFTGKAAVNIYSCHVQRMIAVCGFFQSLTERLYHLRSIPGLPFKISTYCYANTEHNIVLQNIRMHNPKPPFLLGDSCPGDIINQTKQVSNCSK